MLNCTGCDFSADRIINKVRFSDGSVNSGMHSVVDETFYIQWAHLNSVKKCLALLVLGPLR